MSVGVNPYHLIKAILNFDLRKLLFRLIALDRVDFLQVFVPSFLYFALFTFHILFLTKLSLKTQFEIEFLPPNNGGKKVLEKYPVVLPVPVGADPVNFLKKV